jgi:rhodanese-related sulfurtransferase
MNEITREQLQLKLERRESFVLAEALPPAYYAKGHLPGALNLPHDQVDALARRFLPHKAQEIVVYCASATCQNSEVAARRLKQLGYERVAVYRGGKADWQAAGLPLELSAEAAAGSP